MANPSPEWIRWVKAHPSTLKTDHYVGVRVNESERGKLPPEPADLHIAYSLYHTPQPPNQGGPSGWVDYPTGLRAYYVHPVICGATRIKIDGEFHRIEVGEFYVLMERPFYEACADAQTSAATTPNSFEEMLNIAKSRIPDPTVTEEVKAEDSCDCATPAPEAQAINADIDMMPKKGYEVARVAVREDQENGELTIVVMTDYPVVTMSIVRPEPDEDDFYGIGGLS